MPTPRLSVLLFVMGALMIASGCEDEIPEPSEVEGGYRLSMQALEEKNKENFWFYLDLETKRTFARHVQKLRRIDRVITRYFDPTEHKDLRSKTGAYLIHDYLEETCAAGECEELKKGKQLFDYLVDLSALTYDDDEAEGAKISEVEFNEDETAARIISKSGKEFLMLKEKDPEGEFWRNATFRDKEMEDSDDAPEACAKLKDDAERVECEYKELLKAVSSDSGDAAFTFTRYLRPIRLSEKAIIYYAQENLEAEYKRRQKLISYFKKKTGKGTSRPGPDEATDTEKEAAPEDGGAEGGDEPEESP